MPKVPTYQQQVTNQPAEGGRFSADVSPDSFGMQTFKLIGQGAQAIEKLGHAMLGKAMTPTGKEDTLLVRERISQAQSEMAFLMDDFKSSPTLEKPIKLPQLEQTVQEVVVKYGDGLDERQTRMFNLGLNADVTSTIIGAREQTRQAAQENAQQTYKTSIDTTRQSLVATYDTLPTEEARASFLRLATENVAKDAALLNANQPPSVREAEIRKNISSLYESIVKRMGATNPARALSFINVYRDMFDPMWLGEHEDRLKQGALFKQQTDKVDELLVKNNYDPAKVAKEIKKEIQKQNLLPDMAKAIQDYAIRQLTAYEANRYQNQAKETNILFGEAIPAGGLYTPPADIAPHHRLAIEDFNKKMVASARGEIVMGQSDVYLALATLPPAALANEDLVKYSRVLSGEEIKTLQQMQAKALQNKTYQNTPYVIAREAMNSTEALKMESLTLEEMGALKLNNEQTVGRQILKQSFLKTYQEKIDALPSDKRTAEEYRKIANELLTPVGQVKEGWFRSRPKYRFEAENEAYQQKLDRQAKAERARVEKQLKQDYQNKHGVTTPLDLQRLENIQDMALSVGTEPFVFAATGFAPSALRYFTGKEKPKAESAVEDAASRKNDTTTLTPSVTLEQQFDKEFVEDSDEVFATADSIARDKYERAKNAIKKQLPFSETPVLREDGKYIFGYGAVAPSPDEIITKEDADLLLERSLANHLQRVKLAADQRKWVVDEDTLLKLATLSYITRTVEPLMLALPTAEDVLARFKK